MRQTFISLFLIIALLLGSVQIASDTFASGTTTTSNKAGQVVVRDQNGVIYLTSSTNPGGATTSGSRRVMGTGIRIPEGYARDIAQWINSVLSVVMVIAGLLVLMYLIWGAFDWLTSGGDKGKIDGARQKMMAAVVGIIIVSASYAIMLLVISFLGFQNLNEIFESVITIDDNSQAFDIATPTPSPSATPSATPIYSDNLGELMAR